MTETLKDVIGRELKQLFQLKKTERLWHIPVLASLSTGIPLLIGFYSGRLDYGIQACIGGLVILYLPRNFFFIMLASMGSCMPFDQMDLPVKVGLVALGTMLACVLAFLYSLYIVRKYPSKLDAFSPRMRNYTNITESIIIGVFIAISLLVAHVFGLENPYWVPISCLAIMQGVSVTHVWRRSFHRISGTFIGMGLTWLFLQLNLTPLTICISILLLQFVIEMLVVRHYGLAVIFITPMTVFLAEIGKGMNIDPNQLISARLLDIVVGSLIGVLGGWMSHNQQLNRQAERQIRKTRVAILRK
ncbi:FUSC family protein [Pedobacter nyackensis]|uniref:Fusaric acid resistance protein-like n=1 Tax=Pedobacter nyackensis TaxID=475255 RepID=A0A1W2EST3_9SPHI|nr:FUSC family protein [Pedobacter nyackensis]SMD12784.1 Fusaric acid resistance protein-like [Pedobacter nyackensis]